MIITVIGGSGFLGTRLVRRLLDVGHKVRIADKRKSVAFPDLWVRCDVRNGVDEANEFPESAIDKLCFPGKEEEARKTMPMKTLREVVSGCDAVINLAAEHRDDVTPKSLYDDVNVEGSKNICDACRATGVKRLLFTSSVAVYGFAPYGTDESGKIDPFNDYGRTKSLAEGVYNEFSKEDKSRSVVIVRSSAIFGEQNRGNVYNLLSHIASGHFPMVGNGKNKKTINYVENVASFIEFCLKCESSFHIFNYCDEPAPDMNSLVLTVYRSLGKNKTRIFHFPYWLGFCGGLCFDFLSKISGKKFSISSIRVKKFCQNTYFTSSRVKDTGFVPPVSLAEGIRETVDYEFVKKIQGDTFICE